MQNIYCTVKSETMASYKVWNYFSPNYCFVYQVWLGDLVQPPTLGFGSSGDLRIVNSSPISGSIWSLLKKRKKKPKKIPNYYLTKILVQVNIVPPSRDFHSVLETYLLNYFSDWNTLLFLNYVDICPVYSQFFMVTTSS